MLKVLTLASLVGCAALYALARRWQRKAARARFLAQFFAMDCPPDTDERLAESEEGRAA